MKKLELTAREMRRLKAVSKRVTRHDVAQLAVTANFQNRVEYYGA